MTNEETLKRVYIRAGDIEVVIADDSLRSHVRTKMAIGLFKEVAEFCKKNGHRYGGTV